MRYKHNKYFWVLSLLLIGLSIFFLLYNNVALAEVTLVKGTEKIVTTNRTPSRFLKASVEPESINVIKINNEPIAEGNNINLQNKMYVKANEIGSTEITLSAFGLPVKKIFVDVVENIELVPYGRTVGVKVDSKGVMVLGTGEFKCKEGNSVNPSEGVIQPGDILLKLNDESLNNKEELTEKIQGQKELNFKLERNSEIKEVLVKPYVGYDDKNKIGLWVRDSTQGIGTITYYNPNTSNFGALGHGILDIDTKQLMTVKSGYILGAEIVNIVKGEKGSPGELVGNIDKNSVLGEVKINTEYGVYGTWSNTESSTLPTKSFPIATQAQVKQGPATIKSNINGVKIEEYDVFIESVNRQSNDNSKGMVVRITDPRLMSKTNGIVQGMSGSPIIQNGKIIGAITHVFVQDPSKGYGIFIENMLKQEKLI
jgi:stage IV sporulation protein B